MVLDGDVLAAGDDINLPLVRHSKIFAPIQTCFDGSAFRLAVNHMLRVVPRIWAWSGVLSRSWTTQVRGSVHF